MDKGMQILKGRKRAVSFIALLLCVALLISISWMRQKNMRAPVKRTLVALGTLVEIEVRGQKSDDANRVITAAFREAQRIHNEFSPFNEKGALWNLNHAESEAVVVSRELYDLLQKCDDIHTKTDGAFDAAMEPLFKLWRTWEEEPRLPTEEAVETARLTSGWHHIRLGKERQLTRQPGVQISLGAIAKGYAVDRMAEKLQEHGVDNALINAGGDIRSLGKGWVVGIQHPSISNRLIQKITLPRLAVATSGDYEQYHEEKGRRYHHIVDPATGYPATDCRSVTIIAETCIEADAYATGVFVLGAERGLDLVNRTQSMEAMLVDSSGKVFYSAGFEKHLWRQQ
jgi:thiamine biosynthesis lipoprotein